MSCSLRSRLSVPDNANAIPIRAPISSTVSDNEALFRRNEFSTHETDISTRVSYRLPGVPGRHLTRISVIFYQWRSYDILAPEIKPKATANKIYPVEDLTNERQKMLMAIPKAQMTLRLITPTIEHRSGMNVRPTTEVPFNIEIWDTSRFRAPEH